jgi:hypothetical protein
MSEDAATADTPPARLRVLLVSVASGAAAAAAVAIAAPIAMWATESPVDWMQPSLTGTAAIALVAGMCVLILLGLRLVSRKPWRGTVRGLSGVAAVVLVIWALVRTRGLYQARADLPLVDSTGAAVLLAAALLAAVAATVLALPSAAVRTPTGRRTALCVFVVVTAAATVVTYRSVGEHRARVWEPEVTAAAIAPAPPPQAPGTVRYRLQLPEDWVPDIQRAGNGFLVFTPGVVSAYDGPTGALRWGASVPGGAQSAVVVGRNSGDAVGVVVLYTADAVIALDGSTGTVLWRRQFRGQITAVAGSTDALGMIVFRSDTRSFDPDRTRMYSLDPATGALRWNRPATCDNPSRGPGVTGTFVLDCGIDHPAAIDARTGAITELPRTNGYPVAGIDDVYVATTRRNSYDAPEPTDTTAVIGTDGTVLDEIPGSFPASKANDGFLLVWGGGGDWRMRNYRTHQSTPVPLHLDVRNALEDIDTAWLDSDLAITVTDRNQPVYVIDPNRAGADPSRTESPCADGYLQYLQPVAGAVIAACNLNEFVGMVAPKP